MQQQSSIHIKIHVITMSEPTDKKNAITPMLIRFNFVEDCDNPFALGVIECNFGRVAE